MPSFKKARNAIALAYDASWIDDDEFVLLYDACYSKIPEILHKEYPTFDLEELDETDCVMDFCFKKHEIPMLAIALGLPERFKCNQGTIARNTRHVRLRTKHFGVRRSRLEHALCMRFGKYAQRTVI